MTRINLVPPIELYDQHLIAEYREIRMLVALLRRAFHGVRGVSSDRIPKRFTLNRGHVLFFANKGRYIAKRYRQVWREMRRRGFAPRYLQINTGVWPCGYFQDWQPDRIDFALIRTRIAARVAQKPKWYRYTNPVKGKI